MVIVRVAPSPTGLFHVGTARVALYNFLFAKKHGGKMFLRMEDTDRERSKKEYEEDICSGFQRLGLPWDEDVWRQSERTEIYKALLEQLLNEDKAYYCFCSKEKLEADRKKREQQKLPPRYAGTCSSLSPEEQKNRIANGENAVIRFRTPKGETIQFSDIIRGDLSFASNDFDDFVIARNLEGPLFNFTVVVDDHAMGITHVIRGEDHISNTPKQILIFEALGWDIPQFAHLPLILNQDKSKLSKRKNKVSVDDYLNDGFLPEALLNFLALLGWNTADEEEIFSLEELIEKFSLERVHKGGAVFDLERLLWLNGMWIRKKSPEEFARIAEPFLQEEIFQKGKQKYGEAFFVTALSLVQERCKKLSELPDLLRFFFVDDLHYSAELFLKEKMKVDAAVGAKALEKGVAVLSEIPESEWTEENITQILLETVKDMDWKNGQLLWPLRVALSGEQFSPGTFELLAVFGKERSLERIDQGIKILGNKSQ